jgi:hypothetical protein
MPLICVMRFKIRRSVLRRFTQELEIVDTVLHHETRLAAANALSQILKRYTAELMEWMKQCVYAEELQNILILAKLYSYSTEMTAIFNDHYSKSLGDAMLKQVDPAKEYELASSIYRRRAIIEEYARQNPSEASRQLIKRTDTAIRNLIASTKSEKSLVKCFDHSIKQIPNMSEQEIEQLFDCITKIVSLVTERSLFELHYKKYLQRRLMICKTSDSFHYETKVLSLLKLYFDFEQIEHMELAINDVKTSWALQAHFDNFVQQSEDVQMEYFTQNLMNIEVDFKVISFTFWDVSASVTTPYELFPKEANILQSLYEEFYSTKFGNRVLVWLHSVGSAVLTMHTSGGKKELTMSKVQAFLCFATEELTGQHTKTPRHPTMNELTRQAQIPLHEIVLEALGLVCSDVLAVEGKTKKDVMQAGNLSGDDRLLINPDAKKMKSHVKVKHMKPKDDGKNMVQPDFTDSQHDEMKKVRIESSIMKIMKSEKKIRFEELMAKVYTMVSGRFSLNRKDLLESLENLTNKDHIERDSLDPNVFKYADYDSS